MKFDLCQMIVCLAERKRRIFVWRLLTPLVLLVPTVKAVVAADPPWANVGTTISSSITDREVQDRLKLSEDQREKITALDVTRQTELAELPKFSGENGRVLYAQMQETTKRFDDSVRAVLSAVQQKEWSRLQQLQKVSIMGPRREILAAELLKELNLTDKQIETIDGLQKEFCRECERIAAEIEDLDGPKTTERWERPFMIKTREAVAAFDARLGPLLDKTLSPTQQSRWVEIQWQRAAIKQGPAVLLDPNAAQTLELSEKQRSEIDELANATVRAVAEEGKQGHHLVAMRLPAGNLEKALAVLRPSQRAQWNQLVGKPFRDSWFRVMTGESVTKDGAEKEP